MAARECRYETVNVLATLHRKGANCNPAIHPSVASPWRRDRWRIVVTHRIVQKSGDLVLCKAQLVSPDIQQLAANPQPGKRERGSDRVRLPGASGVAYAPEGRRAFSGQLQSEARGNRPAPRRTVQEMKPVH